MKKLSPAMLLLIGIFLTASINAQNYKYIGVKKCSMCHRSAKMGDQAAKWKEGPHSKAYQALTTDKANQAAKAAGFQTPAAKTAQCLKCHVTGYNLSADMMENGFSMEDGVQCETCHGPGSGYKTMAIMKDKQKAVENGLRIWDSDEAIEQFCKGCHNEESPTFKGFNFTEMYPKIKHEIPSK